MPTKDMKKVLELLDPSTPEETRQRIVDFLSGEALSVEEEELVKEQLFFHGENLLDEDTLQKFEKTLLEYAEQIAKKVDAGETLQKWPSHVPFPDMEQFGVSLAEEADVAVQAEASSPEPPSVSETIGVMWEEVRQLASQGQAWAKEQREEIQRCLQGALMLSQMTPAAERDGLGFPAAMGGEGTAAEVVDEQEQPLGTVVPFRVTDAPQITADGNFTFSLHTDNKHWQGAPMVCTLLLVEGRRLSFEGSLQPDETGRGGQVRFAVEALPYHGERVTLPLDIVQLRIRSSEPER